MLRSAKRIGVLRRGEIQFTTNASPEKSRMLKFLSSLPIICRNPTLLLPRQSRQFDFVSIVRRETPERKIQMEISAKNIFYVYMIFYSTLTFSSIKNEQLIN